MRTHHSASLLLKGVLIGTALVPAALFAFLAATSYQSSFTLADDRIHRSLDAVSEHAAKVFQSLSVTFTAIDGLTRGRSDEEIKGSAELQGQLKRMAAALSAVNEIWIIDAEGHPLASSYSFPALSGLDLSDRDYFRAQLKNGAGQYIGGVLTPRVMNARFFAVSRKRINVDGSFAGIVMISVRPEDFHDFYGRLGRLKGSNYAMIREDGLVIARYPGPVAVDVQLDPRSGFMQSVVRNPDSGLYSTISQVDGTYSRYAIRKLDGLPLYVSSGIQVAEIRREWMHFLTGYLLFGLPATGLLVALAWLTLARTKDLNEEAARRATAEESLRHSQKLEAVGQLTGGIAHDFNNLLTVIIGNLEIASRKSTDATLERPLRHALIGAQRAAELTQKLLAFARKKPLSPRPVDANLLIRSMSDLLRGCLGETIEIHTVAEQGLWPIEVDVAELEAAVLNLAVNSRDAMPHGGTLTITTQNVSLDGWDRESPGKTGQFVSLSLTDSGVGMAPDVCDRALEPFFTTKPQGQGTGLGLSQVYGFVKQSGGHLKIDSVLGRGTTIKIFLPRASAEHVKTETSSKPVQSSGRGEIIIIVEDDDAVRSYASEILQELGYHVLVAADAKEALQFIEEPERPLDLLVTDVVMPGLNGKQLAEAARTIRSDLPVLFMTGYGQDVIVHNGRLDPGISLIQKPFGRDALGSKVREVLDSSKKAISAAEL